MGSMCNFVSPRPVMPPHTITFALCFTWKAGGTSRSCKPQTISFFGLAYRKRYLGHSSVNKKFSQSSAVSFARFLANPKRAFLCFALNKGIFFRLKAFHPFLVIYLHTVMLETSIFSAENSWQSSLLNCSVCTSLSRLIYERIGRPLLGLSSKNSLFDHLFTQRTVLLKTLAISLTGLRIKDSGPPRCLRKK